MLVNQIQDSTKENMEKGLEFFQNQLAKVRTGRASASLVDGVSVEYYGSMTPLSQVAGISTPDARTIIIQPFDRTVMNDIEKAIRQADLGFNPQNDGNIIRIPVPPLTEERRKEFVKMCKKFTEEAKVAIRSTRRESMDELKKSEKSKLITEDDLKRGETEVQKITDDHIKKIDDLFSVKEKALLED